MSFWSWLAEERQKDVGGLMRFQDTCGPRHKQEQKQNKTKKRKKTIKKTLVFGVFYLHLCMCVHVGDVKQQRWNNILCIQVWLVSHGGLVAEGALVSCRMNERGVLTVNFASFMVLWSEGLFVAILRYFSAIVWCLCLKVWIPVMVRI